MKIKKTKIVAVLTQTTTTTSTFTSTSPRYAGTSYFDDLAGREANPMLSIVDQAPNPVQRWCGECAAPIAMMPPELAASLCFQTPRAIYRLVEAGSIHFTEGPEGVMVCPASLMKDWSGSEMSLPVIEPSRRLVAMTAAGDLDQT